MKWKRTLNCERMQRGAKRKEQRRESENKHFIRVKHIIEIILHLYGTRSNVFYVLVYVGVYAYSSNKVTLTQLLHKCSDALDTREQKLGIKQKEEANIII